MIITFAHESAPHFEACVEAIAGLTRSRAHAEQVISEASMVELYISEKGAGHVLVAGRDYGQIRSLRVPEARLREMELLIRGDQ